jgi:hypothetical protein
MIEKESNKPSGLESWLANLMNHLKTLILMELLKMVNAMVTDNLEIILMN